MVISVPTDPTDTSVRVPGITSMFILEDVRASITEAVEVTPIATHHERNVSDHAPVSPTLTMETILVINQVPTVGFLTNTRALANPSSLVGAMEETTIISEASLSARLLVDHGLTMDHIITILLMAPTLTIPLICLQMNRYPRIVQHNQPRVMSLKTIEHNHLSFQHSLFRLMHLSSPCL